MYTSGNLQYRRAVGSYEAIMSILESNRYNCDFTGKYVESPLGKMFLHRTKDPVQAARAASEQRKLVQLVSGMVHEEESELEQVAELLRAGVDPSVPDYNLSLYYAGKNFYSPIHYAAKKGFHRVTELLLNNDANPNALDRYSVTPAHLASDIGSVKCMKKLIEYGADVNANTQDFNKRGEYSLVPMVREQWLNPEEFTINILPFEVGTTPLHLAAKKNHIECVKLLIDHGADYNATDSKGQTSLYLAAKGLPDCVMAQLRNAVGFPILSIPTKDSDTALHECLRHGEKMRECIRELVRQGADVGLCNSWGETAVHLAVKYKWDMDMMKLLIFEGYGMDFDRQKQANGCRCSMQKWKDTPLVHVVGDARVSVGMSSSRTSPNRDENLAAFFLRMGASRQCLKELLWHELNREEKGGCLLETIIDSFAYLPPLSELKCKNSEEDNDALSRESSDDEPTEMDIDEPQQPPDARPPNQDYVLARPNVHVMGFIDHSPLGQYTPYYAPQVNIRRWRRFQLRALQRRYGFLGQRYATVGEQLYTLENRERLGRAAGVAAGHHQPRQRQATGTSLVAEKQKQYVERCKEIPTLAHLSRMTVRHALQADVRRVISFPIPTPMKEYILLGHRLSESAEDQETSPGVSEESSAPEESGSSPDELRNAVEDSLGLDLSFEGNHEDDLIIM